MKRFTLFLALAVMIAAPAMAERVSPETARKVATTFLNNNGAKTAQLTDLSKAAGFPNLYIFSTESSFVVMSADDCAKPILGYSLSDKFGIDDMPENMRYWLEQYNDEILWGIENSIQADKSTISEWQSLKTENTAKNTNDVVVGPMLETLWGQGSPYNMYCPSGSVTGCVATAMAQVMYYHQWPNQGQGSYSYTPEKHPEYGEQTANFGETTYQWNSMTHTYNNSSSDAEKQAVATLMYHCGVSVDMDYDPNSSSAQSVKVANALINYFNYSNATSYVQKEGFTNDAWIAFLKSELDDGRPLFYCGNYYNSTTDNYGGHAFVCDGYRTDNYFHFNWGWGGTMDNYFAIGALNPGGGNTGSGQGTYNLFNAVIAWAEPVSTLTAPTLSVVTAEGCVNLTWNAIDEADSYDVYRDNIKIATNITANNYTDNDVISGTYYEYYVRAVNNITRSNPSQFVTKLYLHRDLTPSNLTATTSENNAALSWTGYEGNLSIDLHYGISFNNQGWSADEETPGTYWGQMYPSSLLANFIGMEINSVSCIFYYASNYILYVFNGELTEANKLCEQSHTKTANSIEWVEFSFDLPLQIDCTKDLWVVFYSNDENAPYPALSGIYKGDDISNAKYIGSSLEELPTNWLKENYSWLFRLNLTDGTYTYNIYDGATKLNEEGITGSTFTHENPANNAIHQYTVKTNYYGVETGASNMAGLAVGTASLETLELGDNDKLTILPNSTLIVTGTLSNDNPANLVLEDGAQLIHSNSGVKATVKKDISPYTSNDNGWHFIASPVTESITPSVENGLITNTYDLYYYDEPSHHWKNYRQTPFDLANKQGYLYANNAATTLQFAGTLTRSDIPVSISGLSHSGETLAGFNLVGNPFACNATIDQDCYVISGRQVILASSTKTFAPCEGAFVKATSDSYSVTFTKSAGAKANENKNCLDLVVIQGKTTLDRIRVRFGEGSGMEKFTFDDNTSTQLTLLQDDQEYAVAYADGLNEMPLNVKAAQDGTYTLGIESNSLDLDYLHLIDNLTGADVDLLATPSYTFEAKTTDYASRFKLVFSNCEDAVSDNAAFAYVNNGNIVINQEGTLQIVDMTGHMIYQGDAKHCVSTTGMAQGVYVLRLITADDMKTQKIVVE